MRWQLSWRADPVAARLADRHYSRQHVGHAQFTPPGRVLVLVTPAGDAAWATSWPDPDKAQHGRGDAWVCTLFRNEAPERYLSSELILEALAATRWKFGDPPAGGTLTFIDEDKVRRKRDPGRCFRRAGFVEVGRTKDRGLVILWLDPALTPEAEDPLNSQAELALEPA